MDIINYSKKDYIDILGGIQAYSPDTFYKLASYNTVVRIGGNYAIYNNLTCALVVIDSVQYKAIFNQDSILEGKHEIEQYLVENYFYIPIDKDSITIVNDFRKIIRTKIDKDYLRSGTISGYTILPTTDCNARCFYCYEKGHSKIKMTDEMAHKVGNYIVEHSSEVGKENGIDISWFGGEPLYNTNAIDIITTILRDNNIKFTSGFVSNSYLFNREMITRAVNDWNIRHVQVTIDGTDEVYNKSKNYIYKNDPNPYATIISNIKTMLEFNIHVDVRMNLGFHNAENLKELVKDLYANFGGINIFNVYVYPLFEDVKGFERTEEERENLYKSLEEIEYVMHEYGFGISHSINDNLPSAQCMSDSGHSMVITPTGGIGLCEHYIDEDFFGHIDKPDSEWNWDIIKSWHEDTGNLELCKDCPIYPRCLKIKKCPNLCGCTKQDKAWNIRGSERMIRLVYTDYYKNHVYGSPDMEMMQCDHENGVVEDQNGNWVMTGNNSQETLSMINNNLYEIRNELELSNEYKGLSLLNKIKILFGKDVYVDKINRKLHENYK